ncbi:MAG: NERD domain-containing protein [Calditrichaeota bacterium]|nr:NERD domain-containing protein [Calditrichota bacterium]
MEDIVLTASAALPLDKILTPPVIRLLILAGALILVGALLRSPLVKGWLGELQVNIAARPLLDKRRYHLVKNVTVPSGDGTTQIDHVIVSRYGVFVVETKNMSGWIFGTERDAQWTQKFRKSSFRFQTPLRQNYKHTETIAELLGLPRDRIKSVIVFVGGAQLKKEVPSNVTITGG